MKGLWLATVVALTAACDVDRPAVPIDPNGREIVARCPSPRRIDKLDLLFVIDNAPGMADHQRALARRLPDMLGALTDPTPLPETGSPLIDDVHVAVISSSLGSYGTRTCAPSRTNARNDDRAHLLPRAGEVACPGAPPGQPITWVRDPAKDPYARLRGGEGAKALGEAAACVVASVEDDGCVYPAPWEAAYRFLVDPAPYANAEAKCTFGESGDACGTSKIEITGLDEELLRQRAAFLRPDSVLAVVIVSSSNDASLKPAGLNWLPWGYPQGEMKRGWASCAHVPDDFEPETPAEYARLHDELRCFSCFEDASDPGCKVPWPTEPRNADVDATSLRAFQQVQRFGYDFLYGRQRYVDAFREASLVGADGVSFANPIFKGGIRDRSMIVVATIVGVPPGLVANADGTAKALGSEEWKKITGPIGQRDPHMIESIAPRDGIAVSTGGAVVDPVHGGDRDILEGDVLQAACSVHRLDARRPARAYPGLRHLRIAEGLGGPVASICDADLRPALLRLADAMKAPLQVDCSNAILPTREDGTVACHLVEVLADDAPVGRCEELGAGVCTPGAAPCRVAGPSFPPQSPTAVAESMTLSIRVPNEDGSTTCSAAEVTAEGGNVFVTGDDKKKRLVCELMQLAGGSVPPSITQACLHDPSWSPADVGGWCYSMNPEVVGETCAKLGAPATLRFFGAARRRPGSDVHTICVR